MTENRSPIRILVLCTGNSCRSQMAEGFFRNYGRDRIYVASAGTHPQRVNPSAIDVMRERGIDISGHSSKAITTFLNDSFDYVITVCDNASANCPVFPGNGQRLHWPFDDPAKASGSDAEKLMEFRRVRDLIESQIRQWLSDKQLLSDS